MLGERGRVTGEDEVCWEEGYAGGAGACHGGGRGITEDEDRPRGRWETTGYTRGWKDDWVYQGRQGMGIPEIKGSVLGRGSILKRRERVYCRIGKSCGVYL